MKHLIVIPTYNEYENIEKIVEEFFILYPLISILIVDDSSPDGTGRAVKQLQKKYDNLFLLQRPAKSGLATAYIDGFKWGIESGYDLFSTCDADFSHHPKYLKDAIEKINAGYDVACGSRYVSCGGTDEKHWFRNFISIGGNMWANFVLSTDVKDLLEGFNTYTKSAIEKINLEKVNGKGFIFQLEMKYRAIKAGCKLAEFPIYFEVRKKGKSKMSLNIIFEAFFQIIKLRLK